MFLKENTCFETLVSSNVGGRICKGPFFDKRTDEIANVATNLFTSFRHGYNGSVNWHNRRGWIKTLQRFERRNFLNEKLSLRAQSLIHGLWYEGRLMLESFRYRA